MADDFEKLDLSLPTSDYAQVIFRSTPETYRTEADVECSYTVTQSLEPSNKDWIGIYKVGWRSAREYMCFDWSKIPDGYVKGQKANVSLIFNACRLPKDDGEFYQFCYVTSAGHVRGASTPFQFRLPGADEYVEVEDDEDEDILVIKTKTAILEDALSKAGKEKEELSKTIEYLEKEKETLLGKLISAEKILTQEKEEKAVCEKEYKEYKSEATLNNEEINELRLLHDALKVKVTDLTQDKENWMKRLDDNDKYISSLQQKIKALVNEKDALTGNNKALEEEKELFKNHFTSSEGQVKDYLVEIEELRRKLRHEETQSTTLKDQVKAIEGELKVEKTKVESQTQMADNGQIQMCELTEKLRNSEDKLSAAEKCKQLVKTELKTLEVTFEKLSLDLEQSKSEGHSYKTQLAKHIDSLHATTAKMDGLQKDIGAKEEELKIQQEEYTKLKQMLNDQQCKIKLEEEGSLFALKVAYNNLQDRFEKAKSSKEETAKHLDEAVNRMKKTEREKQEIEEDYRQRLRLAQEEYQKRVVECRHLQTELRKARRTNNKDKEVEVRQKRSQESPVVISDKTQGEIQTDSPKPDPMQGPEKSDNDMVVIIASASASDNTDELTEVIISTDNLSLMELTTAELQDQVVQLGKELENRQKKKQRYKNLYQEEKEKRNYMQQHYFSELKARDEEITRLKRQIGDMTTDFTERIQNFEEMLEEQKMELERRQRAHPPVQMYPPQNPYPMPPFFAPAPNPQPPHFYPPQQIPPINPMHMIPPQQPFAPRPNCPPLFSPSLPMILPEQPIISSPPVPPRSRDQPPQSPTRPRIHTPPPIPSRSGLQTDCASMDTTSLQGATGGSLDPLLDDTPQNLDPPLQPLPPPLSPQKSVDAIVAEVKAINGAKTQTSETEIIETHIDMGDTAAPEEEEDEDRFHDAEEGPQMMNATPETFTNPLPDFSDFPSLTDISLRACPICDMVFPPETLERELHQHVESHMGKTCPVCSKTFDEDSRQEDYVNHVQEHFND